jgi:hypothetical protein
MTPRIHAAALSRREALLFEAGIKMGGVFHQYLGTPVSARTAPALARAIGQAVGLQPYVADARVRIRVAAGGPLGRGRFAYRYLTAEMLDVVLVLADGPVRVTARLAHRPDLRYPLMSVLRASPEPRPRSSTTSARRSGRRAGRSARRTSPSGG